MVATVVWRWRSTPGAVYLAALELAAAQWALAIAWETAATTVPLKLLWSQIAYLGTTTTPLFFLLFAASYAQRPGLLTRRLIALLATIPILTILAAATNPWHGWVWPTIVIDPATNLAIYGHGPWFWIFILYSYFCIISSFIFFYRAYVRSSAYYRSQIGTLIAAAILPVAGNIVYVSRLNPLPGLDWTPGLFVVTGMLVAWSILRLRLLDLVPIARNQLVDTMRDGLLVIDAQGRVADLNPAMQEILGLDAPQAIGQSCAQVLAAWPSLMNLLCKRAGAEADFSDADVEWRAPLEEGACGERCYDVRMSQLYDDRRRRTGHLVVLRDITSRKRLEQEHERLIGELREAMAEVKTLSGLLPMCARCKRIRDDRGYWHAIEAYLRAHSGADVTHGICPACMRELYPEYADDILRNRQAQDPDVPSACDGGDSSKSP